MTKFILTFFIVQLVHASPNLINGKPVGDLFQGVGTFDFGCTITKVGPKHFITAAHCVGKKKESIYLVFKNYRGSVKVKSMHVHPSWIKDCENNHCDGREVGSNRMTPGRSDVAFFNVSEDTPKIPVININYNELVVDQEVALVGAGCTRDIEPGGSGKMRFALTQIISHKSLIHEHSLYKDIAEITGQSDWVTPGYGVDVQNSSLCPGDSGGPMLSKNENNEWEISGIAADYTFNGPYRDGDITITNLHTRLDDVSYHKIGEWLRRIKE